jgi:hypothetical protein
LDKNSSQARPGNRHAEKHGASGLERRIETGLPLRADDLQEKREIQREMGYDPEALPAGPLGLAVELISDNVLLARRFQAARAWAAEQGEPAAYERLGQRSGWRNDKAINQLIELVKIQSENGSALDYEHILAQQDDN